MTDNNPHSKRWKRSFILGGTVLVAGTALVLAPWSQAKERVSPPPVQLKLAEEPVAREGRQITSFAPVVRQVVPSVVQVTVTTKARPLPSGSPELPFFRRFFGEGQEGPFFGPQLQAPPTHGEGSGVIVSKDGYILTNNHVVESADGITVTLNDDREFAAEVIGRDPKTDIAVLKIEARDLPALTAADSDQIEVGDLVLAVGNPFGIGQTVTTGIVSAKGRATLGLDYEDFIQTDAAINPGNSGGALVDIEGRLIGINTAILSRTGGNQGIGFAVPTNLARWVMTQLVDNGRVDRGFLGVQIQDLNPQLAEKFGVDETRGALVVDVTPRSPAAKAGLKSGDVIVQFNDREVSDSRRLKLAVGETAPGSEVAIQVLRDGAHLNLKARLRSLPGEEQLARTDNPSTAADEALRGVGVGDLDDSTRAALKLPEQVRGAVITQVDQSSAAYESGLRPGDVIIEINRQPVANAEETVKACENPKDPVTLVKVWSRGGSRYLIVDETRVG
ncbi:MAG: DegQ family serine endoprotease [Verrucomicrobiales bacterium]|nr:DegQ family serine endoprotease [Verrucomicrobiales bacterium]